MGNSNSCTTRTVRYNWSPATRPWKPRPHREIPVQEQLLSLVHDTSIGHTGTSKRPKPAIKTYDKALYKLPLEHRAYFDRLRPHVPNGYIHVRLFVSMDYVYRRFWRASLEAILPLTPDGGLDLKLVKDLWGLETCIPVSPIRWKAVEPTTSDSLSPFAVVELRELYDCISFIEPPNTEAYRKKRQLQAQKEKEDLLLLLLTVLLSIILYMIVPSSYSPNLPVAWSETLFLASVWFLDFYKS